MRSKLGSALCLSLLLLSGCRFQPMQRFGRERFEPLPGKPEVLRFSGPGFDIDLNLDCTRRSVHWKFRNKGVNAMVLSHQQLQLHHVASGRSYYLWGLPWREDHHVPPVDVKPGTYIGLSFALPVHGEFHRFCARKAEHWRLHLSVERKNGEKQWQQSRHDVLLWSGDD